MGNIVAFLLGIAAGIAWYKFFIVYVIGKNAYTACDYCEFQRKKKQLFGR